MTKSGTLTIHTLYQPVKPADRHSSIRDGTLDVIRGRYLESELHLARRVRRDLQPKPQAISPHVEFWASAPAADHVGGYFYDIFEAESGKIVIVLSDVSGKGVPAALLVSVLQGSIRSSTASQHERACERIMSHVAAFASSGAAPDDRTLMVVRFPEAGLSRSIAIPKRSDWE